MDVVLGWMATFCGMRWLSSSKVKARSIVAMSRPRQKSAVSALLVLAYDASTVKIDNKLILTVATSPVCCVRHIERRHVNRHVCFEMVFSELNCIECKGGWEEDFRAGTSRLLILYRSTHPCRKGVAAEEIVPTSKPPTGTKPQ